MHLSKLRIVTVDVNNDTLEGREVLQAVSRNYQTDPWCAAHGSPDEGFGALAWLLVRTPPPWHHAQLGTVLGIGTGSHCQLPTFDAYLFCAPSPTRRGYEEMARSQGSEGPPLVVLVM